jgi:long-chain acyl-CoA synthetase
VDILLTINPISICFQNLDRKKDLIKLRGGEYVSLTKVETAISKSSMVENCCLCAASSSEYTVVLICPKPKEMEVSLPPIFFE